MENIPYLETGVSIFIVGGHAYLYNLIPQSHKNRSNCMCRRCLLASVG